VPVTVLVQRVEELEAEAFRTSRQLASVNACLDHPTNAVGDLSGDLRAARSEVNEQFTEVNTRLSRIESALTAIAARLGVEDRGAGQPTP
jgi:hypothetical protein